MYVAVYMIKHLRGPVIIAVTTFLSTLGLWSHNYFAIFIPMMNSFQGLSYFVDGHALRDNNIM